MGPHQQHRVADLPWTDISASGCRGMESGRWMDRRILGPGRLANAQDSLSIRVKAFLSGFGSRLLVVGLLMLLQVGMVHADRRNSDPTLRDESHLVLPLLAGGAFGLIGAVLWYLGDRKNVTAGRQMRPTGREGET